MKIRTSEIWEAYAKKCIDEGLISKTAEKKEEEENPSNAELLYGIHFHGKPILEEAHPEQPAIIMETHDPVNSFMRGTDEAHNILMNIVQKNPTGSLTRIKYINAYNDLLNELVKVSFEMDRMKEYGIMVKSDNCLESVVKEAAAPGVWAGIAGLFGGTAAAATGVGLLLIGTAKLLDYLHNNPDSESLKDDINRTITELQEAVEDYSQTGTIINPFISKLRKIYSLNDSIDESRKEIKSYLLNISMASTPEEKKKFVIKNVITFFDAGKDKKIQKDLKDFIDEEKSALDSIPLIIEELRNAKSRYEESDWPKSFIAIRDMWYKYVSQSDTEDAIKYVEMLSKSLGNSLGSANSLTNSILQLKGEVEKIKALNVNESEEKKYEENNTADILKKEKEKENKTPFRI